MYEKASDIKEMEVRSTKQPLAEEEGQAEAHPVEEIPIEDEVQEEGEVPMSLKERTSRISDQIAQSLYPVDT